MESTVVQLLDGANRRFDSWLVQYRAWHGDNDITESNLTFQVALSFLEAFPGGMAFMEVPFAAPDAKRTDRHLDAYLVSPPLALLVEAKIVYAPKHVSWIGDDIARMTPHLIGQLQARHESSSPEHTHGLVIAETWYKDIARCWAGEDAACPGWDRSSLPASWQFNYLTVIETGPGPESTLYWPYGIGPELLAAVPWKKD